MALEWTWGARGRLNLSGKGVVAAILAAGLAGHRTAAVGLGLVAAAVTSHLRVSRLNALKYHVTARSYHPQASRPLAVQARASSGPPPDLRPICARSAPDLRMLSSGSNLRPSSSRARPTSSRRSPSSPRTARPRT